MGASMHTVTRAVIYARQSFDRNGDGVAVDRQQEKCTLLAQARDWELVHPPLVDNDLSAFSAVRRPAYDQLMALIEARQVDAVVLWDMDRLCRRVADLVHVTRVCRDNNVKIASVHGDFDLSSPVGKMFATILIAVAEYEAEHKGERQVAANDQAARAGKRRTACPRPFGYDGDRRTPHPAEGPAVAEACRALLGGSTVAAVAREWDRLGLRPPQGRDGRNWTRTSVTTILRNPRIAGLSVLPRRDDPDDDPASDAPARKYRRKLPAEIAGPGDWTPLVDEETWRATVDLLNDPGRKRPRGVRTLLGGIAACPCGNTLTGSVSYVGQHIYRCAQGTRNGRPGPHVARSAAPVDEHVTGVVIGLLSRPDAARLLTTTRRADIAALHEEAAVRRARRDEQAAMHQDGLITREEMIAGSERARIRLAEIDAAIAEAGKQDVLAPLVAAENAATAWAGLDLASQRAVVSALMTVVLQPPGRGTPRFAPDTVELTPVR